ncbi:UNVERIFIED_CONTAM: Retrovirus-related Pol polyprotein from transposon TNT 1-94 [Sesamum radiatum]|uniref:Retrovirus-related Pol polyprotein from transposon TNT 1-94 n=1 Tax=Sesamum radiatum TaxID=300843 RepID=A0AAW2UAR8_SESRA
MLLMAHTELNGARKEDAWFLDSGCSNHMCGDPTMFSELDDGFRHSERGLAILIKEGMCKIFHPERGLIIQTNMSTNRMFILLTQSQASAQVDQCFHTKAESLTQLWHRRYGHLNYKGLRILLNKEMVRGLPHLSTSNVTCSDCINGKQHRDPISKKSNWRASQKLELIHADICGPITPISNSNKRCPTLVVKDVTPEEAWSGLKPSVEHFRVFGCIAHVHVPEAGRTKLDNRSNTCVLLGDVIFEEGKQWDWDESLKNHIIVDLEWGENKEVISENEDGVSTDEEVSDEEIRRDDANSSEVEERVRRPPRWMSDYVSGDGLSENEDEVHIAQVVSNDPLHFEQAVKSANWRMAMDNEIKSIEKNKTWTLTELPVGTKKIGVKWVYKTKYNENGKIDKYKARLVAKGYSQQHGIDYTEVFAPVARMDTVRMIIALAAQKDWKIFQLDVKSAFLHGELREDVYVEQPRGYEKKEVSTWSISYTKLCTDLNKLHELGLVELKHTSAKKVSKSATIVTMLEMDDRKSTSGYVFLMSSGAVSWCSKKQPIVTLSTIEAEFVAATVCACQGIWMKRILKELGYFKEECITVMCDNSSTIKLSKNPVMHGRSKHIDVRFHFLRNLMKDGALELVYCGSQDQVADIMTKPLKIEVFQKHRKMLGVCEISKIN